METIKKLKEQRSALMAQWSGLLKTAESREWSPEEAQLVAQLQAKVDDLDKRVAACEAYVAADPEMDEETKANEMEEETKAAEEVEEAKEEVKKNRSKTQASRSAFASRRAMPAPGFVSDYNDRQRTRDKNLALRGFLLGNEATNEQRAAAERTGLNLNSRSLSIPLSAYQIEERDNTSSGSAGGYTIPQGFLAELNIRRALFNPMRDHARVIQTETGNPLPLPTTDDVSNTGSLVSEGSASSATDVTFGQVILNSYTYRTLIKASNELLRDTGIDIQAYLAELMGARIGRSESAAFATGSGSSQPQGFVTGASAGITAASATAITINEVVGLINSLDAAYHPNAKFAMHQSVWYYLLKLQDSLGRNLIPMNYADPTDRRLMGHPVILNNSMASSVVTTAKTIAFGDFEQFYIRDAGPLEIRRLDERYADAYETGFLAVGRRDSKVVQANAIKLLTQA
jgi:HK97 family phage major capsid protein